MPFFDLRQNNAARKHRNAFERIMDMHDAQHSMARISGVHEKTRTRTACTGKTAANETRVLPGLFFESGGITTLTVQGDAPAIDQAAILSANNAIVNRDHLPSKHRNPVLSHSRLNLFLPKFSWRLAAHHATQSAPPRNTFRQEKTRGPIPSPVSQVRVFPYIPDAPIVVPPVFVSGAGTYLVGTLGKSVFYNLDLTSAKPRTADRTPA